MTTATSSSAPARNRLAWRGVDLITVAMLAVAFGVIFWGFDSFVYPLIGVATAGFPPLAELTIGVWLLPAVVGGLIVRRPGAALLTELIAANIELLLGNSWGFGVLASASLQGLGVEIILAIFLWRRFGLLQAILGGIAAATLEIIVFEWWVYIPDYTWDWRVVYLIAGIVSGAVIAGLGGWALVRGLARAGALNAFAAGRERQGVRA